jgi:hypothetical protein
LLIKVEFTEQEVRVALNFFELALKSAGDQAADAYIVLRDKLRTAAARAEAEARNPPVAEKKEDQ